MDSTQIAVSLGGLVLIGFTLWFFFGKGGTPAAKGNKAKRYSCPMHPWVASNDPAADCSICGMKLVRGGGEK